MPRSKMSYQDKRLRSYEKSIPIGEQLDAILKAFDLALQQGAELPYELIDIIEKWSAIKHKYPKV